jgi:hypothetical protein
MSAAFNLDHWLKWKPAQARSEEPANPTRMGSVGFEGTVPVLFEKSESKTSVEKIAFNPDGWLKWKPSDTPSDEPTKPTESGSVGFEGTVSALSEKSESVAEKIAWAQFQWAEATLFKNDVRILELDGVMTAGIWADLDSKDLRDALEIRFPGTPISYVDAAQVPAREKVRRVPGEPVALSVVAEMEKCGSCPWIKRDELLAAMNWKAQGTAWTDEIFKITRTAPTKPSEPDAQERSEGFDGSDSDASRNVTSPAKKSAATVFQKLFFAQLEGLLAETGEARLRQEADRRGWPREATEAFLRERLAAD